MGEQEAGLGVEAARYAEDAAGLDVTEATLNARLADRALFQGAERYTDPFTGAQSWMTPNEADERQFAYQTQLNRQRIPTNYATSTQQQQYSAQQGSQGLPPLAGLSDSDLMSQWNAIRPPGSNAPSTTDIRNELLRRYTDPPPKGKGYPRDVAERIVQQTIDEEMERRRKATQGRASATPPTIQGTAPP